MSDAELETQRLGMRPLEGADFEPLWAIWSEPAVREHLVTLPNTREDFRSMFANMQASGESLAMWTLRCRRDAIVVGRLEKLGMSHVEQIAIHGLPVDLFEIQREAWSQIP